MFLCGSAWHYAEELGNVADLMAAQVENFPFRGVRQADLAVCQAMVNDVPFCGKIGAVDTLQNGRFSGARASHDTDKLSLLQCKIDVFTGVDLTLCVMQVKVFSKSFDLQYVHMECPLYSTLDVV